VKAPPLPPSSDQTPQQPATSHPIRHPSQEYQVYPPSCAIHALSSKGTRMGEEEGGRKGKEEAMERRKGREEDLVLTHLLLSEQTREQF